MLSAEEQKKQQARNEKKKDVENYFSATPINVDCQTLVNSLYRDRPDDVRGYAAEFFGDIAKPPTIDKCVVKPGWSTSPTPAVQIELYCIVNGVSKFVAESGVVLIPVEPEDKVSASGGRTSSKKMAGSKASLASKSSKAAESRTRSAVSLNESDAGNSSKHSLPSAASCQSSRVLSDSQNTTDPSDALTRLLRGEAASDMQKICSILYESHTGSHGIPVANMMAISDAVLKAVPILFKCPAIEYLIQQYQHGSKEPEERPMPFLIVPMISGGPLANGKLKWREFSLIVPAHKPINQVVLLINTMYQNVQTALTDKSGASAAALLPKHGTFAPTLDKPEQAMEILQNAAVKAGIELGADVDISVTIAANDLYDQEKNKYEINTGQWKSPADVITTLCDFLRSWPAVKMLIDPLQRNAHQDWQELRQRIGEVCVLVGEDIITPTQEEVKLPSSTDIASALDASKSTTSIRAADLNTCQQDSIRQLDEWLTDAVGTAVWPVNLPHAPTLDDCMGIAQVINTHEDCCMVFCYNSHPMDSELLLDVAVAANCKYLRLPLPTVSPGLYGHLQAIQTHLKINGKLDSTPNKHHFWQPPPQPTPEAAEDEEEAPTPTNEGSNSDKK